MPKTTQNSRKPWTPAELTQLRKLAKQNTPTRVIGVKLGRTPTAVQAKASQEHISLRPANRSPYGSH
ncbi:MAG TPA: hypothetical protein VEL28_13425 [Candidatus Binatia bacterium]|nr:hypothetical protein [Candidatus Binatia bacterium]